MRTNKKERYISQKEKKQLKNFKYHYIVVAADFGSVFTVGLKIKNTFIMENNHDFNCHFLV